MKGKLLNTGLCLNHWSMLSKPLNKTPMKMKTTFYALMVTLLMTISNLSFGQLPALTKSFNYLRFDTEAPTSRAMKVDAQGNIYVTGTYVGSAYFNFNPYGVTNALSHAGIVRDVFLAKYDAGGVLLWIRYGLNENAASMDVYDLALDASGNAYITGNVTGGEARFYDPEGDYPVSGNQFEGNNYSGAYAIKYTSSGEIGWVWNKKYTGEIGTYTGRGIAVDGSGNAFVAGTKTAVGFVTVLNSTGVEQSENILGSNGITVSDFHRDGSGNVYLTGAIRGSANLGGGIVASNANGDVFVAKYNSSFVYQWGHRVSSNFAVETGTQVLTDAVGNVFLLAETNASKCAVYKYNSGGTLQAGSFGLTSATSTVNGRSMVLDNMNNVIISGYYNGTTDFDPGAGSATELETTGAYFQVSYSSALGYNWHRSLGHNNSLLRSTTVAFDSFNKYHMTYQYDITANHKAYLMAHTFNADATAPTATFAPADNASSVAQDVDLVLSFSENVLAVDGGTIELRKNVGNALVEKFTLPSANVTVDGSTVTINPTNNLEAGGHYVTISGGAFRDASGNFYLPITNSSIWNFSTVTDGTPPTVTAFSPLHNATEVEVDQDLTITFSEPIEKQAVFAELITIWRLSDIQSVESFFMANDAVTVSGNTLIIDRAVKLDYNTTYFITLTPGAVYDQANNDFAGFETDNIWRFTTKSDNDVPIVTAQTPAPGSINVNRNNDVVITFDETITTINGGVFGIYRYDTDAPTREISYVGGPLNSNSASFTGNTFPYNTKFYVKILNNTFKDLSNNVFGGIEDKDTWTFTTELDPNYEAIQPNFTSFFPENASTDVGRNTGIQLALSESVATVAGKEINVYRYSDDELAKTFVLQGGQNNTSFILTEQLDPRLAGSTKYYVLIDEGAFLDVWDNPNAAITDKDTWTFTTREADVVTPVITGSFPENASINASLFPLNMRLLFDENIYKEFEDELTLSIWRSDNSLFREIAINYSDFGNELYIDITEPFEPSTTYYITFGSGIIKDLEGNFFNGITDENTWRFTTQSLEDAYSPISTFSPARGATGIATDIAELKMVFSEDAYSNEGYVRLRKSSDHSLVKEWNVEGDSVSFGYDETEQHYFATFSLEGNSLLEGTSYYVDYQLSEVEEGYAGPIGLSILIDEENDSYQDIYLMGWNSSFWTFTTVSAPDTQAPQIVSLSPENGAVNVTPNQVIIIQFDEAVSKGEDPSARLELINETEESASQFLDVNSSKITGWGTNTITIDFAPFEYNYSTPYSIWSYFGFFEDQAGNPADILEDSYSFTTESVPDNEAPTLVGSDPVHSTEGVEAIYSYSFIFSENIVSAEAENSYVLIRKVVENEYDTIWMDDAEQLYFDATYLTITPNARLAYLTEYELIIQAGAIEDLNGNSLQSEVSFGFTTKADNDGPQVVSYSPAHLSTDNSVELTEVVITFDEPIQINPNANTNAFLKFFRNGYAGIPDVEANLHSTSISVAGNQLSIQVPRALFYNEQYHVGIAPELIADMLGNTGDGIPYNGSYVFNTISSNDEEAPNLLEVNPAHEATEVPLLGHVFSLKFNEAIFNNLGFARFIRSSDDQLLENISLYNQNDKFQIFGDSIVLKPAFTFDPNTEYYVILDANTLLDQSKNVFTGIQSKGDYTFTTKEPDTLAPQIVSSIPNIEEPVSREQKVFKIIFDEAINIYGSAGLYLREYDTDRGVAQNNLLTMAKRLGDTLIIDLNYFGLINNSPKLASGTKYYFYSESSGIRDAFGNSRGLEKGDVVFTTAGEAGEYGPEIVYTYPSNGANGVDINNWKFSVLFNSSIERMSSWVYLRAYSNDAIVAELNVANGTMSGDTLMLDFNLGGLYNNTSLQHSTQYYVSFLNNSVRDSYGYYHVPNKDSWVFTTMIDELSPTIISVSPSAGSLSVDVDTNLQITFSEPVQKGTGTILLQEYNSQNVITSWDLSEEDVIVNGAVVTLNSKINLPYNTRVYISMLDGAFTDLSGNNYIKGELLEGKNWEFTTQSEQDTEVPYIVSVSPANGTENVSINTSFVITYSEPVVPNESGFAFVRLLQGAIQVEDISLSNAELVSISGNVMTVNFSNPLSYSSTYTLATFSNMIKDASGNINTENPNFTFYTEAEPITDQEAPVLLSTIPAHSATGVSIETNIVFTFSEPVAIGTGHTYIKIYKQGNETVEQVQMSSDQAVFEDNNLTITLSNLLEYNTQYSFDIHAASVVDTAGNTLQSTITFSFMTESDPCDAIPVVTANDLMVCGAGTYPLEISNVPADKTVYWYNAAQEKIAEGSSSNGLISLNQSITESTVYYISLYDETIDCEGEKISLHITLNSVITATLNINDQQVCGQNDGSIEISNLAGGSNYEYYINGSLDNDGQFTDLPAGEYTIRIIAETGCEYYESVIVESVASAPEAPIAQGQSSCGAASFVLTASGDVPQGGVIHWYDNFNAGSSIATGAEFNTPELVSSFTYYVAIATEDGCESSRVAVLAEIKPQPALPEVDDAILCGEGEATLLASGATTGQAYIWYAADGTTVLKTSAGHLDGAYSVDLSENTVFFVSISQNNCEGNKKEVSVTLNPSVSFETVITPTTCGQNNGSVLVNATGGSGFTYFVDGQSFGNTNQFVGMGAGSFTFKVSNAEGCSSEQVVVIEFSQAVSADVVVQNPTSCTGDGGQILVSNIIGATPYDIYLNDVLQQENVSNAVLSNITSGSYMLKIVDNAACVYEEEISIIQPNAITATLIANNVSVCNGSNGSIAISNIIGGTAPYEFYVNGNINPNGANLPLISNLSAGNYQIEVRDVNGCFLIENLTILKPADILLSMTKNDNLCFGETVGSIDLSVAGGTAPFTYLWSNNADTEDLSGLTAGNYSVLVRDIANCQANLQVTINTPNEITATASIIETEFFQHTGSIDLTVEGGVSPYNILWSNGESTEDLTELAGGSYSVIVLDANNCRLDAEFEVNVDLISSAKDLLGLGEIKVYPNPANEVAYLYAEMAQPVEIRVELVNMLGETVWFKELGQVSKVEESIDLDGLKKGMYLIRVVSDQAARTEKLLIK